MIGIFDSGSGGLTVLRAIREVLPSADVVYFGDIKNAPYGTKSREELSHLTADAISFLLAKKADRIVSACNSVSASLAVSLFDIFSLESGEIIEMVGPTVAYFKNSSARILVVATPATVASGIYQDAFRMIGKEVSMLSLPALAGAIEFGAPVEELRAQLKKDLANISFSDYDALVLACTHYPLIGNLFREVVPESCAIFDPAYAVAEQAKRKFWPREVGEGTTHFYISSESAQFRRYVAELFPKAHYAIEVV